MPNEDKPGDNCKVGKTPRGFRSLQALMSFLDAGIGVGSSMFHALQNIVASQIRERITRPFRFRRDSSVKGHPGYRIPLSGNVDGRHPLNMRRRVDRRNLLRARGLLAQWKYLPRYVGRFGKNGKGDVIRVAIDGLQAA